MQGGSMKPKYLVPAIIVAILSLSLFNCPSPVETGAGPTPDPGTPGVPVVNVVSITNDNTPTWTWSLAIDDPATEYRYSYDESTWIPADISIVSFTPATALGDGDYTLYVQSGLSGTWSASGSDTVTIDTVDPDAPTLNFDQADDLGESDTDGITNRTSGLTFLGSSEENSTINLYEGANLIGTATTDGLGSWTMDIPLPEGSYPNITAIAVDPAGNDSVASNAISLVIDETVSVPANLALDPDDDTDPDGDAYTTQQSGLTISGDADQNGFVTLTDTVDGLIAADIVVDGLGHWSVDVSLTNAVHHLTATAKDVAGNVSPASDELVFEVESPNPNMPTGLDLDAADDSNVNNDNYTSQDANLTISGLASPNMTINVYSDREAGSLGNVNSGTGAWSLDITLTAEGLHSITATATFLGNTSDPSNPLDITIDRIDPATPSVPDLIISNDFGPFDNDNITNKYSGATFTGTADANTEISLYEGTNLLGSATSTGTGDWNIVANDFADGTYGVYARATDPAGNESGDSTQVAVTINTVKPAVSIALAAGQLASTDTSPIDFEVVFSEAVYGFDTGDVNLGGTAGGVLAGAVTLGPATYNVEVTGMTTEGSVTAGIAVDVCQDIAGNLNNATSADASVAWDGRPQPVITSVTQARTGALTIPVTVTFNEAVTGFDATDVVVTNGVLSNFAGSGADYSFDITGMVAGDVFVDIAQDMCIDATTHGNTAAVQFTRTFITEIGYDASASAAGASIASFTVNGTNANRVLIVSASGIRANNNPINISGVTFGTTAMTLVPGSKLQYSFSTNQSMVTALYYLVNPTGAAAITVTFGPGATSSKISAISLYDTNVVSVIGQVATQNNGVINGTSITTNITPGYTGSTLVDVVMGNTAATALDCDLAQTSRVSLVTMPPHGNSTKHVASGATSMAWTFDTAQTWRILHSIVEIRIAQ